VIGFDAIAEEQKRRGGCAMGIKFAASRAGLAIFAAVLSVGSAPIFAAPPANYVLVFSDEFNGASLDMAKWYYRIANGRYSGGYLRAENVSLFNDGTTGMLRLRYDHETFGTNVTDYTGGGVISKSRLGYGYYETRARMCNRTTGVHTSFWATGLRLNGAGGMDDPAITADINNSLLPENNQFMETDGFEQNSTMDIDVGTSKQALETTQFRWGLRSEQQVQAVSPALADYHFGDWETYAWLYTPTMVTFYINGTQVYSHGVSQANNPFNPNHLWLTALPYSRVPPGTPSLLPCFSDFDYVRYYRPPSLQNAPNLLGNGSFDIHPNTNPPLWIVSGWQEAYKKPASYIVETGAHSAPRALHLGLSDGSPYTVTAKQDLTGLPNSNYKLLFVRRAERGQNAGAQSRWSGTVRQRPDRRLAIDHFGQYLRHVGQGNDCFHRAQRQRHHEPSVV
jgi:hypothetical protein